MVVELGEDWDIGLEGGSQVEEKKLTRVTISRKRQKAKKTPKIIVVD